MASKQNYVRARWRLLRRRLSAAKLHMLGRFDRLIPNESQRVFVLTLIIGAVCGLAAVAFHLSIIWTEQIFIGRAIESRSIVLVILVPAVGAALCGLLLTFVAPGARGSGIPQVKVAFAVKGGRMSIRDVLGKFLIGVLQIGSGSSLGREGPTVHICAGIASLLGRTMALSQRNLKRLLPVGAAAGIAAAFNAPIAAVTFTIEEVVGDLDQTVLSGVIVAAAIAAVIERGILGEHPVLTANGIYGLSHASSLVFYGLLGLIGGGVSLVFSEGLLWLRARFARLPIPEWTKPPIGGLVTGVLIVAAILIFDADGINGGGYDTLSSALSGGLTLKVMVALCVMKLVATLFSYSSGGAGGIFAPVLFIGGMVGGVVGLADARLMGHSESEIGAFALVGMGTIFAGVIRAPITSVLIIFEMTGSYGLILPMMISNMTAYALARHFRPTAVYDALLEQDGVYLPHSGKAVGKMLEETQVRDVMNREAVVLDAGLTVEEAYSLVQSHEFTTFPIVDEDDRCVGTITEMRIRRNRAAGKVGLSIAEIARAAVTIYPTRSLSFALFQMNNASLRQLTVVSPANGRFLGIVTMSDIVAAQTSAAMNPTIEATSRYFDHERKRGKGLAE